MAVPKKKKTRARSNQRRSHHALTTINIVRCPECGANTLPHIVCKNCGSYRGHKVTGSLAETKLENAKIEKKAKKSEAKEPKKKA